MIVIVKCSKLAVPVESTKTLVLLENEEGLFVTERMTDADASSVDCSAG